MYFDFPPERKAPNRWATLYQTDCKQRHYMTFSEFYSNKTIEILTKESAGKTNQIFVLIGQTELIDKSKIFDKITEVLKHGLEVDAIHCYSDYMAAGIMGGLQKGGVLIPDDVAVTGFDGRDFSKFLTPNLTTVSQENRRAGELAVEIVINKIEGKTGTGRIAVKVPMSLKIRDSA